MKTGMFCVIWMMILALALGTPELAGAQDSQPSPQPTPAQAGEAQPETASGEAAAQESEATEAADEAPPIPAPERSPEAVRKAMQVLAKSAEAYKKAEVMRDDISLWSPHPVFGNMYEQKIIVEFYGKTNSKVRLDEQGYTFFSVGDKVYGQQDKAPVVYFEGPLETDLSQTLKQEDRQGIIIPHYALRRSNDPEVWAEAVTRTLRDGQIEGFHRAVIDDEDVYEIYAIGSFGDLYIKIDPETFFIKQYTVQVDPVPEQNFEGTIITFYFRPEVPDKLTPPDPDRFKSDDFTKVDSVESLTPIIPAVGDRAPRWHMPKPDDSGTVFLCEDRSKIHYLLFWAQSGDLCNGALEVAEEFSKLGQTNPDFPVNVTCINTLEGLDDQPEELKNQLVNLWAERGYTSDLVYDLNAVAADNYDVRFIPTVIIVDREGNIREKIERLDSENRDDILLSIQEILREDEAAAETKTEGGSGSKDG